jgi:hypothetical protein
MRMLGEFLFEDSIHVSDDISLLSNEASFIDVKGTSCVATGSVSIHELNLLVSAKACRNGVFKLVSVKILASIGMESPLSEVNLCVFW